MHQLDDLILAGAHVSAADRAAWRRWALNPPSLRGGRKKKRKRRKKKLPKTSSARSSSRMVRRHSFWLWTSLCSCSAVLGGLFGALLGLTVDTCTATVWTYFTHYLRADGDSGPGVDSRPALPGSCRATLGSTVDTCIASVSPGFWKNFHIYVLVNSYPEVDYRSALGFRATVSWDFWKNFHIFYVLVTSYLEVDFVLLSVVVTPVETPQVTVLGPVVHAR